MVSKTHIDLREAGRIANILAIAIHFLFIFLGPLFLVYYPFIAINLLAHLSWIYGNSKHTLGFMLVAICWWSIPAFVSIVYIITSAVYPKLYADSYLIAGACLFLGFFMICILATDSTSKDNEKNNSKDPQLSVSYSAANDNSTDIFTA